MRKAKLACSDFTSTAADAYTSRADRTLTHVPTGTYQADQVDIFASDRVAVTVGMMSTASPHQVGPVLVSCIACEWLAPSSVCVLDDVTQEVI